MTNLFKSMLKIAWKVIEIIILIIGYVLIKFGKALLFVLAVAFEFILKYGELMIVIAWYALYTLFILSVIRALRK